MKNFLHFLFLAILVALLTSVSLAGPVVPTTQRDIIVVTLVNGDRYMAIERSDWLATRTARGYGSVYNEGLYDTNSGIYNIDMGDTRINPADVTSITINGVSVAVPSTIFAADNPYGSPSHNLIQYVFTDGTRLMATNRDFWQFALKGRDPFMGSANWGMLSSKDGPTLHVDASSFMIDPTSVVTVTINDSRVRIAREPFPADIPEIYD